MISRRDFLQASVAASAIIGASGFGRWGRLAAQQALTQDQLLQFDTYGNVSLIHVTDIHAQLKPIYFREPSVNLGVGPNKGEVPHITGADFRKLYGIDDGSASHYALSSGDFSALAQGYGKMGGLDRVATVINAIRADRPDAILLDGGDTWHGSMTCYETQGQDMVNVMNLLKPDAMTFHWEFTLGSDRVREIVQDLPFAAMGQNIFDAEWDEPSEDFKPYEFFERGGVKVAVIGQAFPYMPIANPGWMFPEYSFGIRDQNMQTMVDEVWDQLSMLPCPVDQSLLCGGPCEGPLMLLHDQPRQAQIEVCKGVCFTADESMVRELLMDDPEAMRFFVGYAGWGPGQLENELNQGGWLVTPASASIVFDPDADDGLWMRVITGIDRSLAMLAMNPKLIPRDPSMN
jgi:putative AlgH/UPF0301 family transcriptional regulator